jgi:hypothetical protein
MFDPRDLAVLLEYPAAQHQAVADEIYDFIKSSFEYRLLYGVSPNEALVSRNRRVHELANCGSIPRNDQQAITANKVRF